LGTFTVYRRSNPNVSGHLIINEPSLWQADARAFLAQVDH